jgi:hypothetical protein
MGIPEKEESPEKCPVACIRLNPGDTRKEGLLVDSLGFEGCVESDPCKGDDAPVAVVVNLMQNIKNWREHTT